MNGFSERLSHLHDILSDARHSTGILRSKLNELKETSSSLHKDISHLQKKRDDSLYLKLHLRHQKQELEEQKERILLQQNQTRDSIKQMLHVIHQQLKPMDEELLRMYRESFSLVEFHRQTTEQKLNDEHEDAHSMSQMKQIEEEISTHEHTKSQVSQSLNRIETLIKQQKQTNELETEVHEMEVKVMEDQTLFQQLRQEAEHARKVQLEKMKEMKVHLLKMRQVLQNQRQQLHGK